MLFGYCSFGDNIPHVKEGHNSCYLYLEYVNLLFYSSPTYVTPKVPKCIDLECVRVTYVLQRYVILQQLTTEMLASSVSNHRNNRDEIQEASNQKTWVLKHSTGLFFFIPLPRGLVGFFKKKWLREKIVDEFRAAARFHTIWTFGKGLEVYLNEMGNHCHHTICQELLSHEDRTLHF